MTRRLDNGVGDGMATAWRRRGNGVKSAWCGDVMETEWRLHGHAGAVGWRGRGATIGVVERWGGEGVAIATGRRRAGVDVATGWRRRRSVWWGRRESWHQRHGHVVVTVLAGRQRWRHPCRWHDGAGWCGGVRWRSDSVGGMAASMGDGLVTRVVACRRLGVRSTALAAWRLAVTLATWWVLAAFGALDVPSSECCAAVCELGNT